MPSVVGEMGGSKSLGQLLEDIGLRVSGSEFATEQGLAVKFNGRDLALTILHMDGTIENP